MGNFDAIRLPAKTRTDKKGNTYVTNGIKLILKSQEGKKMVYTGLSTYGNKLRNIKVQESIARDLLPNKRIYEKIAKFIREGKEKVKTRVSCRKGEIILSLKEKDETRYTKIGRKTLEDELRDMAKEGRIEDEELNTIEFKNIKKSSLITAQPQKRPRSEEN